MDGLVFTLTGQQRDWLLDALGDASAYREREGDNDDYEEFDKPRRERALQLFELFGGDPLYIDYGSEGAREKGPRG